MTLNLDFASDRDSKNEVKFAVTLIQFPFMWLKSHLKAQTSNRGCGSFFLLQSQPLYPKLRMSMFMLTQNVRNWRNIVSAFYLFGYPAWYSCTEIMVKLEVRDRKARLRHEQIHSAMKITNGYIFGSNI